jgi:hypothetical protein
MDSGNDVDIEPGAPLKLEHAYMLFNFANRIKDRLDARENLRGIQSGRDASSAASNVVDTNGAVGFPGHSDDDGEYDASGIIFNLSYFSP